MTKFPGDAPIRKVVKALERLGFKMVREGNHISMLRENPDGSKTPLTIPNHQKINSSHYPYPIKNIQRRFLGCI